jgi:phosphohistidine phosphatase
MAASHTLWLLRHAKAVVDPPDGGGDHERPLSAKGRRDSDALGKRLGKGGDRFALKGWPDLVLCSTATRTRETAERALARVKSAPPVEYRRSLYEAAPQDVVAELNALDEEIDIVLVVGHNPTAEILAASFARPTGKRLPQALPTCALAVFTFSLPWSEVELGTALSIKLFVPPF